MVAFDVKLAESPGASPVTIIRTNVQWAGDTTVTEFEPAQPMPPFTRFFFHETPKSHKVSWAMGAAFFKAEWLALEAAAEYAEYYANALGASVREGSSGDMYFVSVNELHLMLVVDEKAVRVSCEHHPTQNLALQEALGWNE
jgi:hypothetical protein